jgi:transcriptional regulator with XRE-family HTH domain
MLGARITALRKAAGMNQSQLANKLQISTSAIGMYEQGRRKPNQDVENALADVFNVSIDVLRGRDIDSVEHYDSLVKRLTMYANALNVLGKQKLIERAEELIEVKKYTEDDENVDREDKEGAETL